MDIEQLKLVLEAANTAGEGAFVIALMWIGKAYFGQLVSLILGGGAFYLIYRVIKAVFESNAFLGQTRAVVGVLIPECDRKEWVHWLSKRHAEHPFDRMGPTK